MDGLAREYLLKWSMIQLLVLFWDIFHLLIRLNWSEDSMGDSH